MTQSEALDILKSGKSVFLTGEPGSGKTHTVNQFRDWAFAQGKSLALTASTGIAATHIGGSTIHSWSGVGIKKVITQKDVSKICEREYVVRQIQGCDILVVDEVSMLDAHFINALDFVLKQIRVSMAPFGGVQVVFVGDFFQLPPVVKGTEEDPNPETLFAFEAHAWIGAQLGICYLTEQHRTEDAEFIEILRRMRTGSLTAADVAVLGQNASKAKEISLQLYTHNRDVDLLNEEKLAEIEGEPWENNIMQEGIPAVCQVLIRSMLSPFKLRLKVGAKVMFTRNNFEEGYVNGTIGVVKRFEKRTPVIEVNGEEIEVRRAEWLIEGEHGDTKARCVQYPLRLAYAITVHKSQGMSLDSAKINLARVFEYGQGYVAVSRVRSLAGLSLHGATLASFNMHPKVVAYDKTIKP